MSGNKPAIIRDESRGKRYVIADGTQEIHMAYEQHRARSKRSHGYKQKRIGPLSRTHPSRLQHRCGQRRARQQSRRA